MPYHATIRGERASVFSVSGGVAHRVQARVLGELDGTLYLDSAALPSGGHHRRTFRIHPGMPRGRSFASDIARRYGISYGQLSLLLRERGITPPPAPELGTVD